MLGATLDLHSEPVKKYLADLQQGTDPEDPPTQKTLNTLVAPVQSKGLLAWTEFRHDDMPGQTAIACSLEKQMEAESALLIRLSATNCLLQLVSVSLSGKWN